MRGSGRRRPGGDRVEVGQRRRPLPESAQRPGARGKSFRSMRIEPHRRLGESERFRRPAGVNERLGALSIGFKALRRVLGFRATQRGSDWIVSPACHPRESAPALS